MQLSSVCLTRAACGNTASWNLTGMKSSPKRKPSSWKVHFLSFLIALHRVSPSVLNFHLFSLSLCLPMAAFSKVLSGLWDVNGGGTVVNPRQFYSVFTEVVPYFSGYRWGYWLCVSLFLKDNSLFLVKGCMQRKTHCSAPKQYTNETMLLCWRNCFTDKRGALNSFS